jgi:hypothetical protein
MQQAPDVAVNVGLQIKHARDLLNLTQEQVSEAMGFKDRQTLCEQGKRSVKSDELARFSEALDQEFDFFVDPFSVVAGGLHGHGPGRDHRCQQRGHRNVQGGSGALA